MLHKVARHALGITFRKAGETMIRIYTDGSCLGNPGPGGWAWAIDKSTWASGGSTLPTTNQRMELMAVIEALRDSVGKVTIVTDSAYIVNCFKDKWYLNWSASGIKKRGGEQVKNWDLWGPLLDLALRKEGAVIFEKVKGHSGDVMNDFVDELARKAAMRR